MVEIERATGKSDNLDIFPKNKCNHDVKLQPQNKSCGIMSVGNLLEADDDGYPICEVTGSSPHKWKTVEELKGCPLLHEYLDETMTVYRQRILNLLSKYENCIDSVSITDAEALRKVNNLNIYTLQADIIICVLLIMNGETKRITDYFWNIADSLSVLSIFNRRIIQLYQINEYVIKINKIDKSGKISMINSVDFEGPPLNFEYIDKVLPRENVFIPSDPVIYCTVECSRSNPHDGLYGKVMHYKKGRKDMSIRGNITECNKKCVCPPDCRNRVTQRGRQMPVRIFRTPNGMGWGVQATQHCSIGEYIGEYVGEAIDDDEHMRRLDVCNSIGATYLFNCPPYAYDGEKYGNFTRFINHSCGKYMMSSNNKF